MARTKKKTDSFLVRYPIADTWSELIGKGALLFGCLALLLAAVFLRHPI